MRPILVGLRDVEEPGWEVDRVRVKGKEISQDMHIFFYGNMNINLNHSSGDAKTDSRTDIREARQGIDSDLTIRHICVPYRTVRYRTVPYRIVPYRTVLY